MSIVNLPESIETARLLLRKVRREDAQGIFDTYAQDKSVTHYLSWTPHQRVDETRQFINHTRRMWVQGLEFTYLICLKDQDTIVGSLGVLHDNGKVSVGYLAVPAYQRRGFVCEGLAALLPHLVASKGVYRIWAYAHVDNVASQALLKKLGFVYEGTIKRWARFPNLPEPACDCSFYYYPYKGTDLIR